MSNIPNLVNRINEELAVNEGRLIHTASDGPTVSKKKFDYDWVRTENGLRADISAEAFDTPPSIHFPKDHYLPSAIRQGKVNLRTQSRLIDKFNPKTDFTNFWCIEFDYSKVVYNGRQLMHAELWELDEQTRKSMMMTLFAIIEDFLNNKVPENAVLSWKITMSTRWFNVDVISRFQKKGYTILSGMDHRMLVPNSIIKK